MFANGGLHDTAAWLSAGTTASACGALGAPMVTAVALAAALPIALFAVTVKVKVTPLVRDPNDAAYGPPGGTGTGNGGSPLLGTPVTV